MNIIVQEKQDYLNIQTVKFYFLEQNKSEKQATNTIQAIHDLIKNNGLEIFSVDIIYDENYNHAWDIYCHFYKDDDEEKIRKLFTNYGFIIEDARAGFWITGVKE